MCCRISWSMFLRERLMSLCVQTSWPVKGTSGRPFSISVSFSLPQILSQESYKNLVVEKYCNADTRTNESRFSCQLCLSHSVLSLFMLLKMKRKSLFHPPTGTSGGLGTATCGRNTRLQEWVICFSREIQEGVYIKWPPTTEQRQTENL